MYHLTLKSSNVKTGKIPVSISTAKTCSDSCPLKNSGCYADSGPLSLHWKKITASNRGDNWLDFVEKIKALPPNQLWRHNQAGDLVGDNNKIDFKNLKLLIEANRGKRGFTFTHKPLTKANIASVKYANDNGFTINLSANNLNHADQLAALAIAPIAVIIGENLPKVNYTPKGLKVVTCPAQSSNRVTCKSCGLCQLAFRNYAIGFIAHGNSKKKALIATNNG
jgi:hypothetical protein